MATCKDVARAIASDALEHASWRQRLTVRLHLLMCRHCRRYAAQMRAIGAAARSLLMRQSKEDNAVGRLEATILSELSDPGTKGNDT